MSATILLADDEEDLVYLTKAQLEQAGYHVLVAVDGKQALESIRSRRPDLVLLDQRMPGLDGTEVCQILKADPHLQAIPVILMSVSPEKLKPEARELAHADAYLIRPYKFGELKLQIDQLLARSKPPSDPASPKA